MASTSAKEDNKGKDSRKEGDVAERSFNMEELRELADLVDERGFTDFEFKNEKIRVRMSKSVYVAAPAMEMHQPTAISPSTAAQPAAVEQTSEEGGETAAADEGLFQITSPIVGTFYSSPAPDKPTYVNEGDRVSADTVVCIVEAMKLMNEIQAEISGEIVKVYVENAQPVEFGQPLFGIRQ